MTGSDDSGTWRAGAASRPFPIARGTPLDGYLARTTPSAGTLDPLIISALILEQHDRRLILIAADIVAVDRPLVNHVIAACRHDGDTFLVCASHTHAGPAGIVPRLHPTQPDRPDHSLRARFVAICRETVAAARSGLEPVTIHLGDAPTSGIAANRNDPMIRHDARVTLLVARRTDHSPLAIWVHFACHPTVLGADNLLVSADFPGVVRSSLAHSLTGGHGEPVVLFVNGAAADLSTRFTRQPQDPTEVARLGNTLAIAAGEAIARAKPVLGPLRFATIPVLLDRKALTRPTERDEIAPSPIVVAGLGAGANRISVTRAEGAILEAALTADDQWEASIELLGIALGPVVLIGIPGEFPAAMGQRMREVSPFPITLVIGYANGYAGYLMDDAAHTLGTYEALASPFGPRAATTVEAGAIALLHRLATMNQDSK